MPLITSEQVWTRQPQTVSSIKPYWLGRGLYSVNIGGLGDILSPPQPLPADSTITNSSVGKLVSQATESVKSYGIYMPKRLLTERTEIFVQVCKTRRTYGRWLHFESDYWKGEYTDTEISWNIHGDSWASGYTIFSGVSPISLVGAPVCIAGVWGKDINGGAGRVFVNAKELTNNSGSYTGSSDRTLSSAETTGGPYQQVSGIALYYAFSKALSTAEIKVLSENPWSIFQKKDSQIWIPSAGGGGLSLTGSLTGQGSTLSASATNTEVHAISGALVGAGATLSGTATRIYSLVGALTGQGATLSGSATTLELHAATGALVGAGSTLAATATNTEIHAATGALVGAGSTLSGTATHTPLGINASGSLVGQGSTLSATATNTEVHTCTGALYGQGATLSGALTRVFSAFGSLVGAGSTLSATAGNAVAVFSATGSLVGQGSTLSATATNTETHAVSGSLVGQGSTLSATAALANLHTLSGSLVGSGSSLVGYASGPTTAFEASPDAIVTVINKRNRVSVISRRS